MEEQAVGTVVWSEDWVVWEVSVVEVGTVGNWVGVTVVEVGRVEN